MDLALQPGFFQPNKNLRAGFNPCCNGFSVATNRAALVSDTTPAVSILVVMDLALQPIEPGDLQTAVTGFQSLL